MWVEITVTADELMIISGTIRSWSMGNYVKFFFNKYHQFHYIISVQTAWKDTLELHLMSKKYADKEYVSGCISVLPLTKFGQTRHPFIHGQNLHSLQKTEIPAWEGSPHSKWIPSLDAHFSVKGLFLESSWPFL